MAGSSLWCTQCTNAWSTTQELCQRSSIRSKRDRWGLWSSWSSTWCTCVRNPGQLHLIEKETGASYHMKWTAAISFFSFSTCSIVDQMRIENVCSLQLHWFVSRRMQIIRRGSTCSFLDLGRSQETNSKAVIFVSDKYTNMVTIVLILKIHVNYQLTLCADRPY